jgi:hypothetical protein
VGKGTRGRGGGFGGERTKKSVPTQLLLTEVLADSNNEIGGMNVMIYVRNGKFLIIMISFKTNPDIIAPWYLFGKS